MNTIEQELKLLRECKTEQERIALVEKLKKQHANDTEEIAMENLRHIKEKVNELGIEAKLLSVAEHGISLTHISQKYLGKSRAYLSQRLHRNTVNGKIAKLSKEEINKISAGLKSISEELRTLSASLVD